MPAETSRRTIRIQNLDCSYTKDGEGPPVILLHGWAQSNRSWRRAISYLRDHFSIFALDLPGFGLSDTPKSCWTIRDYAVFVNEFAENIALPNVSIVGHSFGARIAVEYASQFPVQKLVVCATAGEKNTWFRKLNHLLVRFLRNVVPKFVFNAHSSYFTPQGCAETSRIDTARARTMLKVYLKTHSSTLSTDYKKIKCPTLLIYGENDLIAPITSGTSLQKEITHSTLVTIPRAGHFPFVDAPQAVAEVMTNFLRTKISIRLAL